MKAKPVATTLSLLVATLLTAMDVTIVATAMPRITGQLGGLSLYPWVFSAYLVTSTVTVPIWGKLADLFGRRPAFLVGIGLFLVGSLACGAAPSMAVLVWARALQGLGGGAIFPLTQTIFGDIFPVETRARMQGVFSLVWGLASIIGPAVGGAIVSYFSWRWVFLINLPIGAATIVLFLVGFREPAHEGRPHLDILGALLLTGAISLGLVGLSQPLPLALAAGAGALVLAALFVRVERRSPEPLVPLDLLRDPVVGVAARAGVLQGAALFGFIAYVPLLLQGVHGVAPVWAGLAMLPMSVAWSTATFVGGRMILGRGYRPVVRGGAVIVAMGAALLWGAALELPARAGWWLFFASVMVFGVGMGFCNSALIIATQDRVARRRRGAATSAVALSRSLGCALGVAGLGALITSLVQRDLRPLGEAPQPSDLLEPSRLAALAPAVRSAAQAALSSSLGMAFAVTTLIAALGFLVVLGFPDVKAETRSENEVG